MTDYGHDLAFGTFITPTSASPHQPVELAVAAEKAGLDLVTFQDHPYQPGFLDTWTLMSYVAARTERVRISANVANLPLRPPAVLSRAVASLDQLSGGRAELGLGAGGFWDAIEAMGGRRLSPGESVEALSEGIDVIRALWDTGATEPLQYDGTYYSLSGAKRGPAPVHDVGIWVGALKPRMLRLVARKADGWLPSLGYLGSLDALAEGNATIDEAAADADRDPREIRRLLNIGGQITADRTSRLFVGPPQQWAEQITEIALEHGVSGFIVAADDASMYDLVGHEIAPAVREAVTAERAR